MSITIWKPRGYVDGFAYQSGAGGTFPINGEAVDAPFDRDVKVREIARFTGWKKTHFCDTGEFEVTTQAVTPDDVQAGFMVDIDGEQFVIEDVRWEYGDDGYSCTFSGRDFWKFAESQVAHRWIGESFHITGYDDEFTGETLARAVSDWFTTMAAGWWRDRVRFPRAAEGTGWQDWDAIVRFELTNATQDEVLSKTISANVTEIMSYASEWRMFCNWFGVGLRFDFEFDENAGVYTISPVLYDGEDRGIVINTSDRGVSAFEYEKNTRGTVNASFCLFESNYTYSPANTRDYVPDDYQGGLYKPETEDQYRSFCYGIKDGASSFHERAAFFSERYIDAGQAQDTANASESALRAWIRAQAESEFVDDEVSFTFDYDGTGAYRFGEHFGLGDYLTISDGFLGIESKQRLTGVKTVYDSGKAKKREFEFKNQRIKQGDTLRRKFSELNRRTYGAGKQG